MVTRFQWGEDTNGQAASLGWEIERLRGCSSDGQGYPGQGRLRWEANENTIQALRTEEMGYDQLDKEVGGW